MCGTLILNGYGIAYDDFTSFMEFVTLAFPKRSAQMSRGNKILKNYVIYDDDVSNGT